MSTLFRLFYILWIWISIIQSRSFHPICQDYEQCIQQTFNHHESDIVCSGHKGCKEGTILSDYDVTCSGPESCHSNTITTSSHLECSGARSCFEGELSVETETGFIHCSGRQSCHSGTITKQYTGSTESDLIHCSAYESCAYSQITGYGNGAICNGKFSCKLANINIMSASISFNNVICHGLASCHHSTIRGAHVLCNGFDACHSANIRATYILADNHHSIANSKIFGKLDEELHLDVTGYAAAYKAVINSRDSLVVSINFYGYKAGNLAKLVCGNNALCSVSCRTNACRGFTMLCEEGSICNIEPSECESISNHGQIIKGIDCPIVVSSANEYVEPRMFINHESDDEDDEDYISEQLMLDSHQYNEEYKEVISSQAQQQRRYVHGQCYNNEECMGQTMDGASMIECFGPNSCRETRVNTTGQLRCDGSESCRGAMELVSGALLNCAGFKSCDHVNLMETIGSHDCSSKDKCGETGVYCSGISSCSNVEMIRVSKGAIEFESKWSGKDSVIVHNRHNEYGEETLNSRVLCEGKESCLNARYSANIGGQMHCNSYESCANANIATKGVTTHQGMVVCRGKGSCMNAVIDGSTDYGMDLQTVFYCYGVECGKDAILKEITHITVYGTMPGAYIDTGSLSANNMIKIKMYGHKSGANATIKAHLKTKAMVICKGNGCEGLTFDCYDNWDKSGSVCKVKPTQCMQHEYNGKYIEELGIFCPIFVKSKYDMSGRGDDEDEMNGYLMGSYFEDSYKADHYYDVIKNEIVYKNHWKNKDYNIGGTDFIILCILFCIILMYTSYEYFKKYLFVKDDDDDEREGYDELLLNDDSALFV